MSMKKEILEKVNQSTFIREGEEVVFASMLNNIDENPVLTISKENFIKLVQSPQLNKKFKTIARFFHPTGKDVTINFLIGDYGSHTDGKNIQVSLSQRFIDSLTPDELYIMLKAIFIHELEHNISSDFDEFKSFIKEVSEYFVKNYKVSANFGRKLGIAYMNGTEDGRIERIAGQRVVKYAELLRMNNLFIWEAQPLTAQHDELSVFLHQIVSFAVLGAYQKDFHLFYDDTHEMVQTLEQMEDIITQIKYSNNAKDVKPLCWELIKISEPYIAKLIKENKEKAEQSMQNQKDQADYSGGQGEEFDEENSEGGKDQQGQEGQGQGQGQGQSAGGSSMSDEDYLEDDKKKGNSSDKEEGEGEEKSGEGQDGEGSKDGEEGEKSSKSKDSKESKDGKDGEKSSDKGDKKGNKKDGESSDEAGESGSEGDGKKSKSPTKEGKKETADQMKNDAKPEKLSPKELEKAIKEEIEANKKRVKEESSKELNSIQKTKIKEEKQAEKENSSIVSKKEIEKMVDKHYKDDYNNDFKQVRRKNFASFVNEKMPSELLSEAKKYKRKITTMLEEETQSLRGLDRGRLDVRDLHKLAGNKYNVFTQTELPQVTTACAFALDGSGSMYGYPERELRKMMAIFEEIFIDQCKMNIQIFSTTGSSVVHHVVKEWDDEPKNGYNYSYNGLYARQAGGGNKDGYSIRMMVKELELQEEETKILFVLSDGLPSCYSGGSRSGMSDVNSAVREAKRKGIIVIPIMFGDRSFLVQNKPAFQAMYGNNIIATEREKILPQLVKIMKKLL